MPRIGTGEIILILVVVVLLFGAKKLPDLARSLGSAAKEFRKGAEEGMEGDEAPDDTASNDTASNEKVSDDTSTSSASPEEGAPPASSDG